MAECKRPLIYSQNAADRFSSLAATPWRHTALCVKQPEREARDFGDIAELLRVNRGQISRRELEELCRQFAPPEIGAKLLSLL
jgi:hypothetical protein